MSLLRSVFGPSKEEIWAQIAKDIGGHYEEGGLLGRNVLRYRAGEWEITLDIYKTGGSTTHTYTRMRAPFVNKDGLYFSIEREGIIASIGKRFGMQDIQVGDPDFDDNFLIKGNHEEKIRQLLSAPRMKQLIQAQPEVHFRIRDDEGWFSQSFPHGVDELYFECTGAVKDAERLKGLFELFSLTLERLVQIDSAYESDPGLTL